MCPRKIEQSGVCDLPVAGDTGRELLELRCRQRRSYFDVLVTRVDHKTFQAPDRSDSFSMEGATLCALHFRELRKAGLILPEDEAWIKKLLLNLRKYHFAWRPRDGFWRGPHHRSQAQGINHALAATFYPDEPDVESWKRYAADVWSDWWDYRDVGINDSGYFYSSFCNILRAAELLGRKEVFTDPESRQLFERIIGEITPDGAGVPYGASGGYHGQAGACIFALELAGRYTGDGRYR